MKKTHKFNLDIKLTRLTIKSISTIIFNINKLLFEQIVKTIKVSKKDYL
jgi:hypothetical protein